MSLFKQVSSLGLAGMIVYLAACGKLSPPAGPVAGEPSPDTEAQLRESLGQAIEAAESILHVSPGDPDALLAAALAAEHPRR